jgi:carbonic anhydrase/acetyltransferase-like protein (isoleucine patch superfamily)
VSLILGPRVTMNDPSSAVVGDSVWLKAGASVYDVQANELVARRATVLGTRTTNVAFPFAILPVTPDIDAGHQTLTVDKRHTRTLAPGAYGHVQVQHGATLVLTGGLYQFASLALEADATLVYRAAAEIRIGGDLETGARAVIAPDAAGLAAASLKIEVDGCEESDHRWIRHDRRHLPRPARAAVRIGAMNTIQANVLALESGITIGARTEATGAFIGDEVFVGPQVRLRLDSAF